MNKKYEQLRDEYPEYISLEQFYKLCHISKRSAHYLVERGIVPVQDSGKRTWRYQIAMEDVIVYLQRRERGEAMIPMGATSSCRKNTYTSLASVLGQGKGKEVARYFEHLYVGRSDVLTAPEIVEMTGLSQKTIMLLLQRGELKSLTNSPRYLIPKKYLLEFVASTRYIESRGNSHTFYGLVKGFKAWKRENKK